TSAQRSRLLRFESISCSRPEQALFRFGGQRRILDPGSRGDGVAVHPRACGLPRRPDWPILRAMRVVKTVAGMSRLAVQWKGEGSDVGFVPTMGYLHEGHLSLVRRARKLVGRRGKLVVSVYVNPTQFGPNEDLARYPRDLTRDLQLCRAEGVDVV